MLLNLKQAIVNENLSLTINGPIFCQLSIDEYDKIKCQWF
jgi:hypothetical protein